MNPNPPAAGHRELRARYDEVEAHARKDLWALDRASAAGDWQAQYGYNLPSSNLTADGEVIGQLTAHREGLADGAEDQHAADAFLVSRLVRTARRRAEAVLRDVEAKRRILDRYEDCLARLDDPNYSTVDAARQLREYEDFILPALALTFTDHSDYGRSENQ